MIQSANKVLNRNFLNFYWQYISFTVPRTNCSNWLARFGLNQPLGFHSFAIFPSALLRHVLWLQGVLALIVNFFSLLMKFTRLLLVKSAGERTGEGPHFLYVNLVKLEVVWLVFHWKEKKKKTKHQDRYKCLVFTSTAKDEWRQCNLINSLRL